MKEAIEALGPDPLAEYMRSKGFDPDEGCNLLIPAPQYNQLDWGPFGPPMYVRAHKAIAEPLMINPKNVLCGEVL